MGSSQSTPSSTATITSSSTSPGVSNETCDKDIDSSVLSTTTTNNDDTNKESNKSKGGGGSGCPMHNSDGSYTFNLGLAMFSPSFPHRPGSGNVPLNDEQITASKEGTVIVETTKQQQQQQSDEATTTSTSTGGGCPMKSSSNKKFVEYNVYSQPIVNPNNNMPQNPNQLPASTQSVPLSTHRVPSTIPKGGASDDKTTWTYPSPQMFYNALSRKGKLQDTTENDIESVVALHNNMNEKTWKKVVEWEEVITKESIDNGSFGSKLLKFQGRPSDLSPKAAFKYYILGHPLPYDRHDWTIVRTDGTEQRYVIDYYYDDSRARTTADTAFPDMHDSTGTPSLLVDVRPAVDTITSVWYRSIIMPYARHVSHTTKFEPLPMIPTSTMKSHVQESIDVWQSIQQYVANRVSKELEEKQLKDNEDSIKVVIDEKAMKELISEKDAKVLNTMFMNIAKDCQKLQKKVDSCTNDIECTKASIDLTLCMGKILCPLQCNTLTKALVQDDDDDSTTNIDTALTRLNDCVTTKTTEYQFAKKHYPTIVK